MCGNLIKLVYFSITCLCVAQCRKYDIEAESQKLYGEDLKGALKKFRKSYDYIQILQEKTTNTYSELMDSNSYLEDYYAPQIPKKVQDLLGIKDDGSKKDESVRKSPGRQNEEENEVHTTQSDVQMLDEYVANKRMLTVPEINSAVNLGFEFAGKIIHGMLSHMGGDFKSESAKSTKLPYADSDDKDMTSTKMMHDHSVTNEGPFVSTAKPETPEPEEDKFAFRAKNDKT